MLYTNINVECAVNVKRFVGYMRSTYRWIIYATATVRNLDHSRMWSTDIWRTRRIDFSIRRVRQIFLIIYNNRSLLLICLPKWWHFNVRGKLFIWPLYLLTWPVVNLGAITQHWWPRTIPLFVQTVILSRFPTPKRGGATQLIQRNISMLVLYIYIADTERST